MKEKELSHKFHLEEIILTPRDLFSKLNNKSQGDLERTCWGKNDFLETLTKNRQM